MSETIGYIICDCCKNEFLCGSTNIGWEEVVIGGKALSLTYFVCPYCNTVYRVLLVEEKKYRELVNDIVKTRDRIKNQQGKGNPALLENLQNALEKKKKRIRRYVDIINRRYPGTFILASENNQSKIVYLPREARMKGENKNG